MLVRATPSDITRGTEVSHGRRVLYSYKVRLCPVSVYSMTSISDRVESVEIQDTNHDRMLFAQGMTARTSMVQYTRWYDTCTCVISGTGYATARVSRGAPQVSLRSSLRNRISVCTVHYLFALDV
jgi:hypothetical protein